MNGEASIVPNRSNYSTFIRTWSFREATKLFRAFQYPRSGTQLRVGHAEPGRCPRGTVDTTGGATLRNMGQAGKRKQLGSTQEDPRRLLSSTGSIALQQFALLLTHSDVVAYPYENHGR